MKIDELAARLIDLIIAGRIQPGAKIDGLEGYLAVLHEILIAHVNVP